MSVTKSTAPPIVIDAWQCARAAIHFGIFHRVQINIVEEFFAISSPFDRKNLLFRDRTPELVSRPNAAESDCKAVRVD
jgi:hypothetical protein